MTGKNENSKWVVIVATFFTFWWNLCTVLDDVLPVLGLHFLSVNYFILQR
jgi:hypothetical protein